MALISILFPWILAAQVPVATLDTTVIRVGEQATLMLSVDLEPGSATQIEWPEPVDTLGRNVEVVSISMIDTVATEDAASLPHLMHLVRELKITSFDTGYWAIAPFRFTIDGKAMETAPLLLEVRGVDLGDAPELRDIKDIHEIPFSLLAWLRMNWYLIAGILAAGALVWWAIGWYGRRQRRTPAIAAAPEPEIPLHERIVRQLRALDEERLWQNGAHKEYHVRLTDLLRHYIEERYQVAAMERTTDELMQELRVSPIHRDQLTRLRNMFELSDMVKFAKAVPAPMENEQMMQGALRFVQETSMAAKPVAHV